MKKVAVITGGGSGIGLAVAEQLALTEDWSVILVDLQFSDDSVRDDLLRRRCDIADEKRVSDLFAWVKSKIGRLDFLVNCAGFHCAKSVTKASNADFAKTMAVNLAGPFYCMRSALSLLKANGGSIVNVGSDVCFLADKDAPLYTAAKMGLMGLTKAAALEWGAKGVRINMVCPGATDTPFFRNVFPDGQKAVKSAGLINPMKRIGSPKEVAEVIIFLGLQATFANAAVWPVDGGYTAKGADEPKKQ